MRKRIGPQGIGKIYGQEKNITTYNLARMNMLLHGVKVSEFVIFHGDTLLNEWDMMREPNPAKKPSFDAIVAKTRANGWKVEFIHVAVLPMASDETVDRNQIGRLISARMKKQRGIELRI